MNPQELDDVQAPLGFCRGWYEIRVLVCQVGPVLRPANRQRVGIAKAIETQVCRVGVEVLGFATQGRRESLSGNHGVGLLLDVLKGVGNELERLRRVGPVVDRKEVLWRAQIRLSKERAVRRTST